MTKIYLKHGQKAPAWAHVETGPKGGKFYEDDAPPDPSEDIESEKNFPPEREAPTREQPGTQPVRHGMDEDSLLLEDYGLKPDQLWEVRAAAYGFAGAMAGFLGPNFARGNTEGAQQNWEMMRPWDKKMAAEYVMFTHYVMGPDPAPEDSPYYGYTARAHDDIAIELHHRGLQETGSGYLEEYKKLAEDPVRLYKWFKAGYDNDLDYYAWDHGRYMYPDDYVEYGSPGHDASVKKIVARFWKEAPAKDQWEVKEVAMNNVGRNQGGDEDKFGPNEIWSMATELAKKDGIDLAYADAFLRIGWCAYAAQYLQSGRLGQIMGLDYKDPLQTWANPVRNEDGKIVDNVTAMVEDYLMDIGKNDYRTYQNNPDEHTDLVGKIDIPANRYGPACSDPRVMAQTEAVGYYCGTGFNEMKGLLRGRGRYYQVMTGEKKPGEEGAPYVERSERGKALHHIANLDSLIRGNTLIEDREIFHGFANVEAFDRTEGIKVGDTISDRNYTSWSDDNWVSYDFTAAGNYAHGKIEAKSTWNPEGLPLVLHIKNAKGLHGVFSDGRERETVLPHGMHYNVTRIDDMDVSPYNGYNDDPTRFALDNSIKKKWRVITVEPVQDSWVKPMEDFQQKTTGTMSNILKTAVYKPVKMAEFNESPEGKRFRIEVVEKERMIPKSAYHVLQFLYGVTKDEFATMIEDWRSRDVDFHSADLVRQSEMLYTWLFRQGRPPAQVYQLENKDWNYYPEVPMEDELKVFHI